MCPIGFYARQTQSSLFDFPWSYALIAPALLTFPVRYLHTPGPKQKENNSPSTIFPTFTSLLPSMLAESNGSPYGGGNAPKLRTACENCRQSKVKCNLSGKNVCTRCLRHGLQCQYGFANRSGKPKGSKNRATLRKLGQLQEDKPPIRGFRGNRIVPPVADREPRVPTEYPGHMGDSVMDDDVGKYLFPIMKDSNLYFLDMYDSGSTWTLGKPKKFW